MTLQLAGTVPDTDDRDAQIAALQREASALRRDLAAAKLDARHATEKADAAMANLRRQLSPLYRALQMVFGELDAAGVTDGPASAATATPTAGKWDEWKARLGPSCAKVIDALLLGGDMSTQAIKVAARMGTTAVYEATSKMGRAGILEKNGGKFSLKRVS